MTLQLQFSYVVQVSSFPEFDSGQHLKEPVLSDRVGIWRIFVLSDGAHIWTAVIDTGSGANMPMPTQELVTLSLTGDQLEAIEVCANVSHTIEFTR